MCVSVHDSEMRIYMQNIYTGKTRTRQMTAAVTVKHFSHDDFKQMTTIPTYIFVKHNNNGRNSQWPPERDVT